MGLSNISLRRFISDTSGNIAVIWAVSSLVLMTAVAFAIDTSRLYQASNELQDLNDVVALAVVQGDNLTLAKRRENFNDLMLAEIKSRPILSGLEFDLTTKETRSEIKLNVTSRSEVELFFGSFWGDKQFASVNSEVIISNQTLELALVLDISSSMKGTRLPELQNASRSLIEQLLDGSTTKNKVTISLVPFGGTVRLPSDLDNMLTPPPTTDQWTDGQWNGCLRMTPQDYQNGIWPSDEFEYVPDFYTFSASGSQPWCPVAGNELVPLSTNKENLFATIDNFHRSDGTGTDIGVAWGYATLDPTWRGRFNNSVSGTPRAFNKRTRKIMVVMSDGGITGQYYPSAADLTGTLPFKANDVIATADETHQGYVDICNQAKSRNIEIYTVGFSIDDPTHEARLKECATSLEQHFSVEEGGLEAAFDNIALAVDPIRLSQ